MWLRGSVRRSTIAVLPVIAGLLMLMATSAQRADAASSGCKAINAMPAQKLAPWAWGGQGLTGTFAAGDTLTYSGTPAANVYAYSQVPIISDNNDLRFASGDGGPATFVINASEAGSAWLSWSIVANGNPGGLTARISCKPAPVRISCPPGARRTVKNGKAVCVCVVGGVGLCS